MSGTFFGGTQCRGAFGEFFAILGCDAHFKRELCKMAGDRPRQPAIKIFNIKRRFKFQPLYSTRPAHESYFSAIGLSNVKSRADRHRHAAYHNKHMVTCFSGINNIDDLE